VSSGVGDLLLPVKDDGCRRPPARVRILEQKVESLEKLPARMEALELQILQFRERHDR
jgi:hypothetical protein